MDKKALKKRKEDLFHAVFDLKMWKQKKCWADRLVVFLTYTDVTQLFGVLSG